MEYIPIIIHDFIKVIDSYFENKVCNYNKKYNNYSYYSYLLIKWCTYLLFVKRFYDRYLKLFSSINLATLQQFEMQDERL